MAPAFGLVEAKGLLPYFMESATKARELCWHLISKANSSPDQMADKWSSILENSKSGDSAIIDVNMWLGKAALDACVSVSALDVRRLWVNRGLTPQKDWCWSFRLRLWRIR